MNKISKKIVALVTMAAFVLTLVPFAAFAAVGDGTAPADAAQSGLAVAADNGSTATVAAGEQLKVAFRVNDESGAGTSAALSTNSQDIKFWATTEKDDEVLVKGVDFLTDNDGIMHDTNNADQVARFVGNMSSVNNTEFYVTFNAPGTYVLYSGYTTQQVVDNDKVATSIPGATVLGKTITVTVTDPEVTTSYIDFNKANGGKIGTADKNNPTVSLDLTKEDFEFNGTAEYTIKGTAYEKDGTVASYDTFDVSTNKDGLIKITSGDTVTAKNDGTFSITFTMEDTQNGYITLSNDDVSYSVYLIGQTVVATDINTTVDGGYVLAGTDGEWKSNTAARYFTDAVQFELKDAKGNVLTGEDVIAGEPAASEGGAAYKDTYINITKPEKSTLTSDDLQLVWKDGVYTLYYRSEAAQAEKDLIPGKYQVTVALADGDHATATFNVAEFGTVKDLALSLVASDYDGSNEVAISDKVTLGQKVTATAKYVDENGLKIAADDVNVEYGFDGKAVYNPQPKDGIFYTAFDIPANESLLGTTINVKAYDNTVKKLVETELTVVDSYTAYSLAFDSNNGEINNDNTVKVSVVDEDGNVAKVNGIVYAYVEDQSNEDAKVTVDTVNNGAVQSGKATLTLYADQETTADIRVVVVTNDEKIYVGALEYAFGSEDLLADRSVVMTIGSTEYVVNNNIVTGDAAPYVSADYRTMVPIRALAESFGAEVDFKDNVVTIVDGDTTVVMTIGETTYTVNGEEATMDVAPVIGSGDRTYVPIRFVAEALGYKVTPLYAADGTTASVVFQK